MSVIKSQISPLFELPIDWNRVVLVYEPVWAFKDEKLVACEVAFPTVEIEEEQVKFSFLTTSYELVDGTPTLACKHRMYFSLRGKLIQVHWGGRYKHFFPFPLRT